MSILKKIAEWLGKSNRWKHLLGGVLIGVLSDGWYCAGYAGAGVGCAMELKDRQWGGQWDWIDAALTLTGAVAGYGARTLLI